MSNLPAIDSQRKSLASIALVQGPQLSGLSAEDVLNNAGHSVLVMDSFGAYCEAHESTRFDAVVVDLRSQEATQLKILREIAQSQGVPPVIALFNRESVGLKQGLSFCEAAECLAEPLLELQLKAAVGRAVLRNAKRQQLHVHKVVGAPRGTGTSLIGRSPSYVAAVNLAKRVAATNANVLITGESGTGKELFARFIHENSKVHHGPFLAINCSAIPEALLESELFGHAKGSFTGAAERKIGLFEAANGGTVFLDEIGDLALALQAKILRVLQERKIKRVGETTERDVVVRIVSATHKNLVEAIQAGTFREDLYFRLNVIPIEIPPLRDRSEDISVLVDWFLVKFSKIHSRLPKKLSLAALELITGHTWPGNVRELENVIERAVILSDHTELQPQDLMLQCSDSNDVQRDSDTVNDESSNANADLIATGAEPGPNVEPDKHTFLVSCLHGLQPLGDVVRKYIQFAVHENQGAKDRTAKDLGMDRKTLYKKLLEADGPGSVELRLHKSNELDS